MNQWQPKPVDESFVSSLIYGMAHDFGANVRHVVQFSKLLSADGQADNAEFLAYIQGGGEALQAKLQCLRQLSALGGDASLVPVAPRAICEDILADVGKSHSDLAVELEGDWPQFLGRVDHWQVLLQQLIANAVLYHPKEDQHKKQISIGCASDNHVVQLTVTDNGLGVGEDMWASITRSFKRLQSQDDYPGAGMGLSYCDYIAQLNGGVLSFSHADSGGLRVSYTQPLANAD